MAIKNFFNNIASIFDGNPNTTPTNTIGQGISKAVDWVAELGKKQRNKTDNAIKSIATGKTGDVAKGIMNVGDAILNDTGLGDKVNNVVIGANPILTDEQKQELKEGVTLTPEGAKPSDEVKEPEPNGNSAPNEELTPNEQASLDLEKIWAREDAIRKETQAREDSAYQRAVADMRKAGINPELLGVNPASSGGGVTQASRKENVLSSQISALTQQMTNALSNEIKQEQGAKDRVNDIISTLLMAYFFKKK